jgi:hypothetical protein
VALGPRQGEDAPGTRARSASTSSTPEHPITKGISNFDWKDEVYNAPRTCRTDVHVLAHELRGRCSTSSWPAALDLRADVGRRHRPVPRLREPPPPRVRPRSNSPHLPRAPMLRGIAWAGASARIADEFRNARGTRLARPIPPADPIARERGGLSTLQPPSRVQRHRSPADEQGGREDHVARLGSAGPPLRWSTTPESPAAST